MCSYPSLHVCLRSGTLAILLALLFLPTNAQDHLNHQLLTDKQLEIVDSRGKSLPGHTAPFTARSGDRFEIVNEVDGKYVIRFWCWGECPKQYALLSDS